MGKLIRVLILILFIAQQGEAQTPARASAIQTISDSIRDNTQKLIKPLTLRRTLFAMMGAVKDSTDILNIINVQKGLPNGLVGLNNLQKIPLTYLPTETDPSVPNYVKAITSTQLANWDAAFLWGNHASAGYMTQAQADLRYSLIPHNHNINNLSGVTISSPSDGQVLKYNLSLGRWENGTVATGNSSALADSMAALRTYIDLRLASCGCHINPMSILQHPTSQVATTGASVTFTAMATGGTTPYTWQWRKSTDGTNWVDIANATTPTYVISNVTLSDAGSYSALVRDALNATLPTNTATLTTTANAPPTVNAGTDQTITLPTNTATLTGIVTGSLLTTQWSKEAGSPSGGTFGNATQTSTSVTGLIQGVYTYRLTATDNFGRSASDVVTITVNPEPATTQFQYSYTADDPYVDNSTAPTLNSPASAAPTGNDLIFSLPQSAGDQFVIVRVPSSVSAKTTWYHNTLNSGTIPDQTWRAPFTVGGFTYYITRAPFVLDYTSTIQLRQ